jgi:hypothetical protein
MSPVFNCFPQLFLKINGGNSMKQIFLQDDEEDLDSDSEDTEDDEDSESDD